MDYTETIKLLEEKLALQIADMQITQFCITAYKGQMEADRGTIDKTIADNRAEDAERITVLEKTLTDNNIAFSVANDEIKP